VSDYTKLQQECASLRTENARLQASLESKNEAKDSLVKLSPKFGPIISRIIRCGKVTRQDLIELLESTYVDQGQRSKQYWDGYAVALTRADGAEHFNLVPSSNLGDLTLDEVPANGFVAPRHSFDLDDEAYNRKIGRPVASSVAGRPSESDRYLQLGPKPNYRFDGSASDDAEFGSAVIESQVAGQKGGIEVLVLIASRDGTHVSDVTRDQLTFLGRALKGVSYDPS